VFGTKGEFLDIARRYNAFTRGSFAVFCYERGPSMLCVLDSERACNSLLGSI